LESDSKKARLEIGGKKGGFEDGSKKQYLQVGSKKAGLGDWWQEAALDEGK
jgi:hypothetical protein